jgi:hypothetical protein
MMNPRIKEIALECYNPYGNFDLEKFAQLMVRQCVSIVAKRKDRAIDDGWNIDEAMSMAEMDLEEHFGIEE